MQLSYRGVRYPYTPSSVDVTGSEMIGRYRGLPCKRLIIAPVAQTKQQLCYRGVAYVRGEQSHALHQERGSASVPKTPVSVPISISPGMRMHDINELDKVHHRFMRKSLEHRLAVAKAQGDNHLVEILEAEKQLTVAP